MSLKTETDLKHEDLLLKITELEGAANKFFSIFQHSNDAIMLVDPKNDKILEANPRASELLEYSHDELLKLPMSAVHPNEMPEMIKFSNEVLDKGQGWTDKLACFTKSKKLKASEISGSKVIIKGKELIVSIIRDVTEQKETEARLKQLADIVKYTNDAVLSVSVERVITSWNPGAEKIFGYLAEEIIGKPLKKLTPKNNLQESKELLDRAFQGEHIQHHETKRKHKTGHLIDISLTLSPVYDERGKITTVAGIAHDVSEEKQNRTALEESEERYRKLFEASDDAAFVIDIESKVIIQVNQITCKRLGYTEKELIGLSPEAISAPGSLTEAPFFNPKAMKKFKKAKTALFETCHLTKDGKEIPVEVNARIFDLDGKPVILALARDITERKLFEQELMIMAAFAEFNPGPVARLDEKGTVLKANPAAVELFDKELIGESWLSMVPMIHPKTIKALVMHSSMTQHEYKLKGQVFMFLYRGIPNEDLVMVYGFDITERKRAEMDLAESELKFRGLIQSAPNGLVISSEDGTITLANSQAEKMFGYDKNELLSKSVDELIPMEIRERHAKHRKNYTKKSFIREMGDTLELVGLRKDGTTFPIENSLSPVETQDGVLIMSMVRDVTRQKAAETALAESELKFRGLLETAPNGIIITDKDGSIVVMNAQAEIMFDYKKEEILGQSIEVLMPESFRKQHIEDRLKYSANPETRQMRSGLNIFGKRKNGEVFPIDVSLGPLEIDGGLLITSIIRDITESKQIEEVLQESEERYRLLFQRSQDAIFLYDLETRIFIEVNDLACERLGYTREEFLTLSIDKINVSEESPDAPHPKTTAGWENFLAEKHALFEVVHQTKDGRKIPVEVNSHIFDLNGKSVVLSIARDITQRKQDEEQLNLQNSALVAAANGIVITDTQGSIVWVNPAFTDLTGYSSKEVIGKNPRILKSGKQSEEVYQNLWQTISSGKTWAGEIINRRKDGSTYIEGQTITPVQDSTGQIVNFIAIKQDITERKRAEEELKILNETLEERVQERTHDLQITKNELMEAYDETLEGWMRALDLRDHETEGHTQRVTELTVQLARCFGIPEEEIRDIRRGALLHDIGKIAIPDHILLKPGPLTDEEWKIMKEHPHHAKTMLTPIEYLRPAMSIPHYHHEHYDGDGYPHGLKGEAIPLPARLFAVIDVWDALTNDRPYRKAWPEEKVIAHLIEQKGKYFDPKVVDVFLENCIG